MAAKYDGISGEILSIKTGEKTFSVRPALTIPSQNKFSQVLGEDSKVRFSLYDYSKGKGEQAVYVMYNLELKNFKYLGRFAKICYLPEAFSRAKIYGKSPERGGQYNGLCPAFRINIARNNEAGRKYPWTITITNGYAKASTNNVGGYYEVKGTFVKTKEAFIYLDDIDFQSIFDQYELYEEAFVHSEESKVNFASGYSAMKDAEGNRSFNQTSRARQATVQQPVQQNYSAQPQPVQYAQPVQSQPMQYAQPVQSQPVQSQPVQPPTTMRRGRAMECKILDQFLPMNNGTAYSRISVKGQVYDCYFDVLPNEVVDAQRTGSAVTLLFYQENGLTHCAGVA